MYKMKRKEDILNRISKYNISSQELFENLLNNQNIVNNIKRCFQIISYHRESKSRIRTILCYQYGYEISKDDKLSF